MKKLSVLIFILVFLLTATLSVGAASLTAKSMGMGGAYTAVGRDISTVLYNPAGITRSGNLEVHGSGGVLISDMGELSKVRELTEHFESGFKSESDVEKVYNSIPDDLVLEGQGFLGGNINNLGMAVNFTDEISTQKYQENGDDINKLENVATMDAYVSYGKEIVSPTMDIGSIAYGASFKYSQKRKDGLELTYDEDTPENSEVSNYSAKGNGFGADLGTLIKATDLVRIGIQLKNAVAPQYSMSGEKEVTSYELDENGDLKGTTGTEDFEETLELDRQLNVGVAVDIPLLGATAAMDLENFPIFGDGEMTTRMGIEKNLIFNAISLRAGTFKEPDRKRMYTVGAGVNLLTFHVDAAIGTDKSLTENQMLLLSGNIKF